MKIHVHLRSLLGFLSVGLARSVGRNACNDLSPVLGSSCWIKIVRFIHSYRVNRVWWTHLAAGGDERANLTLDRWGLVFDMHLICEVLWLLI